MFHAGCVLSIESISFLKERLTPHFHTSPFASLSVVKSSRSGPVSEGFLGDSSCTVFVSLHSPRNAKFDISQSTSHFSERQWKWSDYLFILPKVKENIIYIHCLYLFLQSYVCVCIYKFLNTAYLLDHSSPTQGQQTMYDLPPPPGGGLPKLPSLIFPSSNF